MNTHAKKSLIAASLLGAVGLIAWVIAGIPDTFDPSAQPVGYVGQPAISGQPLYTGSTVANDTRLYAIDYDGSDWSGDLHSYHLSPSGSIVKTDDWTGGASANIDVQSWNATTGTARKIITRDPVANTNIQFRWATGAGITSTLSLAQRTLIDPPNAPAGHADSKLFDYLRGDRSNEAPHGSNYRTRSTVLGDIIHSTPIYCPATNDSADPSCTVATVFVGANDGMLHAINTTDGSERFAYVPSLLIATAGVTSGISKLVDLTSSAYNHENFVDGRMDLRRFGNQTILAGALGSGGQGLFGLDVTNSGPATETAAASNSTPGKIVLWEITNATTNFANLGYTYGQPVLRTLSDGTNALIVGNGYGNSGNYKASLFIINPLTGALLHEIVTTDNTPTSTNRNGLSSPTLDGNNEYAYAGDLNGNLWKFHLVGDYAVTKLYTTNPAQPITMAPGLGDHPTGVGLMVTFVTGQMLLPGDATDTSTYYAYGIWDGAPANNTTLLTQTLTEQSYTTVTPAIRVRTATNNAPDWTAGHNLGWQTALPIGGERVVGDGAYVAPGNVFLFMSTNPTINATPPAPDGENWWMQLNSFTGGDVGSIRFDLDGNGSFTSADQVTVGGTTLSPVGRFMGGGRRSQLTAINASTFVVYQSNYDKNAGDAPIADAGVSGGHFDYDIYYYSSTTGVTVYTPTSDTVTNGPFCLKSTDVDNEVDGLSPTYCKTAAPYNFPAGYGYMTDFTPGAVCGGTKAGTNQQMITCATYTTSQTNGSTYTDAKHVHQYDDIYNVTGVNMLHPSDASFKVTNMKTFVTTPSQQFKILVMNQFLNPAAKLAVGPNATEESVKTYGSLASQTDPAALLAGLTNYTVGNIGTFIFDLPKTAFQSKDWWGSGGDGQLRAGLIPTQTGCVNHVGTSGQTDSSSSTSAYGNVRSDGALTFQLIDPLTPASALEMNYISNGVGDVRYGWRVKQSEFALWVFGEYTTFWHHPNGKCLGQTGWVQNPPQVAATPPGNATPAPGAADPTGNFGGPGGSDPTVTSTVTNKDGSITTTYSNGTVVITYPDGSTKTTTSDGNVTWTIPGIDTGGVVDTTGGMGGTGGGGVVAPGLTSGRISWRELRR